jgi:hypothetical protein
MDAQRTARAALVHDIKAENPHIQAAITKLIESIGDRTRLVDLRSFFGSLDTNGDGSLDQKEFGEALVT